MCFAEHVFFARLGARSGVPQRRDFARRAAQRRVQCTWYAHNVFTEPTGRKCVPARANRRRTRTRIALWRFITRRVDFFARDIAPARLRHAYRALLWNCLRTFPRDIMYISCISAHIRGYMRGYPRDGLSSWWNLSHHLLYGRRLSFIVIPITYKWN